MTGDVRNDVLVIIIIFAIIILLGGSNHDDDDEACQPCIIRFMGSLTALLVLASMMPVFTGDLPKASYTKVLHDVDDHFVMAYDDVGA